MSNLKFAETHNLVAFLEKPKESDGFEGIIDFLNASSIRYALTVNPTIYTSCIKQFWATAKAKTVNGEVQIQALVDGKKVIVTETSVRRALQLKDAEGTECLPNATIFAELERMGYENLTQKLTFYKAFFSPQWKFLIHTILQCLSAKTTAWNKFSSTMASAIICFSGRVTPLFQTMMVQAPEELGEGSETPTDPQHTLTIIQPSTSQPQNKQTRRKQRKDTKVPQPSGSIEPITDEAAKEEHVPIHSNDPLLSGEDRLKLNELMELCTNLSQRVLDLENIKTSQAAEIAKLKERVKKLEKRNKSRTPGLKRLRKVGRNARIESSDDEGLGAEEYTSKHGRKIADLNANAEVTLVDEAQVRIDDNLVFDTGVFNKQEVEVEKVVNTAEVTIASATTTTINELNLAQTLIEIKAAKPKAVTTVATTTTNAVTRPKARGVVVQEPSEFRTTTSSLQKSQLPQVNYKGKAKIIKPEKPLKRKDQILVDEEIAQRLQKELQAELEEEERLVRQKEEEDNLISSDNTQAMMEADYELAQRLQAEEQGELTIKERSKLFLELMDKRKKHFAKLRAKEIRRKPPTKAQKRNHMCNYLKNMANYKHSQLKNKSFEEIQMLFDNTMKWVDSFVPMDSEVVEGSKIQAEGSKKRTREELKSDNSKKQKIDKNVEAEVDDEAELKKHIEIVPDDEVAINDILLATMSPIIIDWKIIKEGKMGYFQIIKADGSSRRPEEAYERVLWGDRKVMFKPDVESEVWRNLQGYNVTVWKLFSSNGVHFVRFQNLHIFMLVEKKYPLTPATITKMLNKKLQTDNWNEMCYQLLKLMTKECKNLGSV
ncbi:hypothetical protein Tco_0591231 [Tanacetum coccineum]